MHALRLTTRFDEEEVHGDACLLVYDVDVITGAMLSEDARDQFNLRPTTKRIYILAPFIPQDVIIRAMHEGSIFDRVGSYFHELGGTLFLMGFATFDGVLRPAATPFNVNVRPAVAGQAVRIDKSLKNGWLFDLFDSNKGLISAPPGVHFGKGSRKHSTKFLRASGILLTSTACAVVAYFTLGALSVFQPRRIFVDTSPLLAIAFALQRVAGVNGLWHMVVPVSSFSSYGGLGRLPAPSTRDVILISASTSGGLARELTGKGFATTSIATLFYLGQNGDPVQDASIVCDLTFVTGAWYGYTAIDNFAHDKCPLCKRGFFLAELEGDQFLLESRAVKELKVRVPTQPKDARDTLEALVRNNVIRIPLISSSPYSAEFDFDLGVGMKNSAQINARVTKIIRRYTPSPLDIVVLVDIDETEFRKIMDLAGLTSLFVNTSFVLDIDLRGTAPDRGAGVLVYFNCLKDYARIRDINAELRVVAEDGCVAYLSAITLAESPEHLDGLKRFLTFGAGGRDSFTYASAYTLMMPFTHDDRSSWDLEIEALRRIREKGSTETEIVSRLADLVELAARTDGLFWRGKSGEIGINNDFVFLNTAVSKELISHADLYATVANLLASARAGDRSIMSPIQQNPVRWEQSVYGHTLLSVENFENYNDAVLRAAFLRAATSSELHYSAHEMSSARMLSVLRQGLLGWEHGMGDFLAEAFLALATHRLVLTSVDIVQLKQEILRVDIPQYLRELAAEF
jgi:hypothetical protein